MQQLDISLRPTRRTRRIARMSRLRGPDQYSRPRAVLAVLLAGGLAVGGCSDARSSQPQPNESVIAGSRYRCALTSLELHLDDPLTYDVTVSGMVTDGIQGIGASIDWGDKTKSELVSFGVPIRHTYLAANLTPGILNERTVGAMGYFAYTGTPAASGNLPPANCGTIPVEIPPLHPSPSPAS